MHVSANNNLKKTTGDTFAEGVSEIERFLSVRNIGVDIETNSRNSFNFIDNKKIICLLIFIFKRREIGRRKRICRSIYFACKVCFSINPILRV